MRLMKYSFICPICDRSYYTYVEQKRYQEIFNNLPVEENFKGYPDYYQKMMSTYICPDCQHIKNKDICLHESDSRDEILYNYIQELELDARKAI